MKKAEVKAFIPTVLTELHSEGEPAALYPEIARGLFQHDERYIARRAAISGLLSKVGIHMPIVPDFPPTGSTIIYPALYQLEEEGIIEGYFQPARADGYPRRRVYRLAKNPNLINE